MLRVGTETSENKTILDSRNTTISGYDRGCYTPSKDRSTKQGTDRLEGRNTEASR